MSIIVSGWSSEACIGITGWRMKKITGLRMKNSRTILRDLRRARAEVPEYARIRPKRPRLAIAAVLKEKPMKTFATPDLCDANEDRLGAGTLRVLAPVFRAFGRGVA